MEKLTAADASFFYSETPRCSSNIASVQIMELPGSTEPQAFITSLKDYIQARAHLLGYLTNKPVFVPGNLDHPVWTKDENFDINNHIIEYPVPAPGTWEQVENAVAAIHNIKMPMDRPLWAMYVLTGLADGKIAYYQQTHHAAIDGASGNATFDVLMDETPEHPPVPKPETNEKADRTSSLSLVESALQNFVRFQFESATRLMGITDSSARLMQRAVSPSKEFGAFGKIAPATPFNGQVSDQRLWKTGQLPLADIKRMGKLLGATINDMVMVICAGGLRRYLERHGQLPAASLIAGCPVSLRKPGDSKPGNQVTMMNVELATHIADPVERLAAIRSSAKTAKEVTGELSGAFEDNASLPGLPTMMSSGINALESFGVAQFLRGPVNVVISNVPGPRTTRYSNGARMTSHYPVSIVTQGLGVNITVQSYVDQIYLGITTCAKAVPDADLLRDDILAAYAEFKDRLFPENVAELKPRTPIAAVPSDRDDQEPTVEVEEKVA